MEKYELKDNVKVFGIQVKTFPYGIEQAFDALFKMLPAESRMRSYCGISKFGKDGSILYYAAAEEIFNGEAEKYSCDRFIIEKGEYLTETIYDWYKKTDCIKDVFHILMQDTRIDKTKPCVEWYKSNDEMICMVKMVSSEI